MCVALKKWCFFWRSVYYSPNCFLSVVHVRFWFWFDLISCLSFPGSGWKFLGSSPELCWRTTSASGTPASQVVRRTSRWDMLKVTSPHTVWLRSSTIDQFRNCIQINRCFFCQCLVMSHFIHLLLLMRFLLLEFTLHTLVVAWLGKPLASFVVL